MLLIISIVSVDARDTQKLPEVLWSAEQKKSGVSLIAVVLQGASGTTAAEAVSLLNYGFDNFQLLSLGDNDFDMASGGNVFVPNGTTADALTTQDGEVQDGQYNRQFLFNGTPVGTAVMSVTSPEEDTAVIEGQHTESDKCPGLYSQSYFCSILCDRRYRTFSASPDPFPHREGCKILIPVKLTNMQEPATVFSDSSRFFLSFILCFSIIFAEFLSDNDQVHLSSLAVL